MVDLTLAGSQSALRTHLGQLRDLLSQVPNDQLEAALALLLGARTEGRRVYVMGNGGSASTSAHFVCDIQKTATVPGQAPLRTYALTDNVALMTAWANDTAYEKVFAEQIRVLVDPGDVVIAISVSGNSLNVVAGLEVANQRGAHTIALVGCDGGAAGRIADVTVLIPSSNYGLVEDVHSALGHALTAAVRQAVASSTGG